MHNVFFSEVQQFDVNSVLLLLSHHRADSLLGQYTVSCVSLLYNIHCRHGHFTGAQAPNVLIVALNIILNVRQSLLHNSLSH